MWELIRSLTATGQQCVYCNREIPQEMLLCAVCEQKEKELFAEDAATGGILHVFRYEGIVRELIRRYKYDDMPRLAFFMAQRMADFLDGYDVDADMVSFVPIHKNRMKARGFDQAEMLASHLSMLLGLPIRRLLARVRDTKPQYDLTTTERTKNIRGAFALCGDVQVTDKRIILIDDIYTSGATMGECVHCLAEVGADVTPFVFSKEYSCEGNKGNIQV